MRRPLTALALLASATATAPTPAAPQTLAITDVNVVDVGEGVVRPGLTVVVSGDRIMALGPSGSVDVPGDARVVDGTGRFLIPGLWDMHVHTGSDRNTREIIYPLFVAHGVTGVRNMMGDCFDCGPVDFPIDLVHARRRAVAAGELIGPRVLVSSAYAGSHEQAARRSTEGSSPHAPATAADARAFVRLAKERGADFIKVYDMLPREAYFALAEEAKRLGLPFAGHVPVEVRASEASDAGQSSIEHRGLGSVLEECSSREDELRARVIAELHKADMGARHTPDGPAFLPLLLAMVDTQDPAKCAALAERFVRNGTWRVPTLMTGRLPSELGGGWRVDPYARFLPPEERRYFEWAEETYARDLEDAEEQAPVSRWAREATRAMHRAGVRMLAGSDAGETGIFWGISLHQELELLVSAGLTAADALRAATLGPAQFLGATDSLGTVESGKLADLVLLEANPLDDIANTQQIAAVLLRGRYLDREALAALLTGAERAAQSRDPTGLSDTVYVSAPTGVRDTDRSSIVAALGKFRPGGTVLFAPGTYLIGGSIDVSVPDVTLAGNPAGTTLRGCHPGELVGIEPNSSRCAGLDLAGGRQTVRNLTFEHMSWASLQIVGGRNETGRLLPTTTGGHLIEGNTLHAVNNRLIGNTIAGIARHEGFPRGVLRHPLHYTEGNGSGIWISPGSNGNEIAGNIFEHIASHAVVIEGDSNRVNLRSASDGVHDLGSGNQVGSDQTPTPSAEVRARTEESFRALSDNSPTDTVRYQVVNHGRHAGTMEVVTLADTVVVHFRSWDRASEVDAITRYVTDRAGTIVRLEVSTAARPDPFERFALADGTARWRTETDSGTARVNGPAFYWPQGSNAHDPARLAAYLLAQPQRTADLLPFHAPASAQVAVDTIVVFNGSRERVRLVVMDVPSFAPYLVWLDARGELFASDAAWFTTIRAGAESTLPVLRSIERRVLTERSEAVARRLTTPRTGPLVIRNGNLFDSEAAAIRRGMTVVVDGERIIAVGAEGTVPIPAGATIIDATGKTVLPGLWDMHGHVDASSWGRAGLGGILALANGITTVRDLAADVDRAVSFRDGADAGTLISPRLLLAGFIDGPGRSAGPTDAIVSTQEEAIEWVARYDSLGYRQIKVYNLVHPAVVATIAEEAKRRGMRLSGHVPRMLGVTDVVQLGFDEIQHMSFLLRFFLPDSLRVRVEQGDGLEARAQLPAIIRAMDVDGPEATGLIEFLRDHDIVIDGTLTVSEDRGSLLPDGTDPLYGPTLEWFPPIARRGFTVPPTPAPLPRRRLQANYHRFLKRLYDAGVTIVPGTDNIDFAYTGELEIYERVGIPAPDVLRIATLVPAQVMGEDRDYGSIEAGKVADIIIVDGDPATRIRDLRKVETVVRAGRVYAVRDLYAEVGVRPTW